MQVEVRFTLKSALPQNGISYNFETNIGLYNEGAYKAVAKINYRIKDGEIANTERFLRITIHGSGLCQDSITLQSDFAHGITWDFAKTGKFSKPTQTVTVDGTVGQFSYCSHGPTSIQDQKNAIFDLGVNQVRVIVVDGYKSTQNYVNVEYRLTSCKYLHNTRVSQGQH